MSFLLAKVLFLVAAAALLGAWFARWYLRRNFQDVTADYLRLEGETQTWRRAFEEKLAQRPAVDLKPLQAHMERIDASIRGINIPKPVVTDLAPVMGAIAAIPVPSAVNLQPLRAQLEGVEEALKSNLTTLLASVSAIRMPEIPAAPTIDLSAIQARLDALESAIRAIVIPPSTQVDLQPVMQKLADLEARATVAPSPPTMRETEEPPQEPRLVPVSVVVSTSSTPPSVRAGSRNLLSHAGFGTPDNLQQIKGVKKVMEKMLHDIGVYYFWQISEWTPEDVRHADAQLTAFHGRIERDDWITQATEYGRAPDAASKPSSLHDATSTTPEPTQQGRTAQL